MATVVSSTHESRLDGPSALWIGRVLSGVVVAFLLLDGAMKLLALPVVGETMVALGWPADAGMARLLGWLTIGCALLYVNPRTALLGAIVLTAYLGGAVATHVRVGSPLFSQVLFGVYVGIAAWGGLWLRDPRLRACFAR
jgi:uncharacterized membrane protein YphA (DoxX/SURF4 family)